MLDIRVIIQSIGRGIDRISNEDITTDEMIKTLEVISGLSRAAAGQLKLNLSECQIDKG